MFANRRYRVNGALETIEIARDPVYDDFKGLIVVVPADFTFRRHFDSMSGARFAAPAFFGCFGGLIMFGVRDSFFGQLFGERLFI